jgi:hypothetical protein
LKKRLDLSALKNRVTPKNKAHDKFKRVDQAFGLDTQQDHVIRSSHTLLPRDVEALELLTKRCMSKEIVTNDSQLVRLGLLLAVELPINELVDKIKQVPVVKPGRPKKR